MKRSKTQQTRKNIEDLKEELRHLTTERIALRLNNFSKSNDISIAYKEILKERGVDDYFSLLNKE